MIYCDFFFQFLEHEKQRLRGQLELMEDEYEQRILELQTDIDTLKAKLNDSGDSDSRLRERSNLVAQLVSHMFVFKNLYYLCIRRTWADKLCEVANSF